jgi:hypothetical protein
MVDIEFFDRLIPSRSQLDACLTRLVDAGLIGELEGQRFIDGRSASGRHTHSAFTDAEYESAKAGKSTDDEADPGLPSDEHLLVTVPFVGDRAPTPDDWRLVEELASRMCEHLGQRGRATRVVTLRTSPGRIEFSVLGHATDDPNRLRAMVLPLFEAIAPSGSSVVARQWESWADVPRPTG